MRGHPSQALVLWAEATRRQGSEAWSADPPLVSSGVMWRETWWSRSSSNATVRPTLRSEPVPQLGEGQRGSPFLSRTEDPAGGDGPTDRYRRILRSQARGTECYGVDISRGAGGMLRRRKQWALGALLGLKDVVDRMDRRIESKEADDEGKAERYGLSPAPHDATKPDAGEQEERCQERTRVESLGKCP
jgi:hypothetical protein